MLAGVLPAEEMPLINDQIVTEGYASRKFITDVSEYTPYYQDILFLYRTGISVGAAASSSAGMRRLVTGIPPSHRQGGQSGIFRSSGRRSST